MTEIIQPSGMLPDGNVYGWLRPVWGTPLSACPSTFPRTPEGTRSRLNAMGSSTLEPDRNGVVLMEVAHVLAYPREEMDEVSGELKRYNWLVLVGTEGETWGTSSVAVAEAMERIVSAVLSGDLPWPVTVSINTRHLMRDGRMRHDLKVV